MLLGSRDKPFEVLLHAGTAAAVALALRNELRDPPPVAHSALMFAPAALAGFAFERPIERRLGREVVPLAQLLAGGLLLVADLAPARRARSDARARDAAVIGLAQACALVPGVSRNGATLSAARALGFRRDAANRLSRDAGLPVIVAAAALKLLRLARRREIHEGGGKRGAGRSRPGRGEYATGTLAAFGSSLAAARLVPRIDRLRSYAPIAIYRIALGALTQWRR